MDHAELDRALTSAVQRARLVFAEIGVDDVAFVEYVAERLPPDVDVVSDLSGLHVEDLYLACACLRRVERALAVFDERILSGVPRFVARVDSSPDFADGVRQTLREKLFLSEPVPKIAEYAGRGPLAGWVRVVALRTALNSRRSEERSSRIPANALTGTAVDPELDFLKSKYAREVKAALESAVSGLPIEARNILRMHYLDHLTIDQIASVHEMHRSSVARRISEARRSILDETKRRLRERLEITTTEIDSVVALVKSRLELSLRLLFTAE
jgi:RNA polymerase sigma-70 factor (ECF subfamily)